MRRWQAALLATVMALGAAALLWRARGEGGAPKVLEGSEDRETIASVEGIDFAPYLEVAHALAAHEPRPATSPPLSAGGRVFVTAWAPGQAPVRATATGKTLFDGVLAASEAVAARTPAPAPAGMRVEIDVLTSTEPVPLVADMAVRQADVGIHGYLARGSSPAGFVLPTEILEDHLALPGAGKGMASLNGDRILTTLAARAGVSEAAALAMPTVRFTVAERVEAARPGDPPLPLLRGMPLHPTVLSPEALLSAVRAGADYLARSIDAHGVFAYVYDPSRDEVEEAGYDLLRHAGAIYALMEAYEELHVPEWKTQAEAAIGYLKSRIVRSPDGSYFSSAQDEEQQKVGASGIGLVALAQYEKATGGRSELPTMRELARFIVHQQYPDGHYRDNADVQREDAGAVGLPKEVTYYAGEAVLGLVRMHAVDTSGARDEWLASARKGADYLVHVRDAQDDLAHQIQDHWLSYALYDLYALSRDMAYAAHAQKIADAIVLGEKAFEAAPYPDYKGAFYGEGESAPTSTRLEALASTIELARFLGRDEAPLRPVAMQLACFARGQQLDADSAYFTKNPARSIGGVRRSLLRSEVRIDFVQHAMSGWLRLARLLRDPSWGAGP